MRAIKFYVCNRLHVGDFLSSISAILFYFFLCEIELFDRVKDIIQCIHNAFAYGWERGGDVKYFPYPDYLQNDNNIFILPYFISCSRESSIKKSICMWKIVKSNRTQKKEFFLFVWECIEQVQWKNNNSIQDGTKKAY